MRWFALVVCISLSACGEAEIKEPSPDDVVSVAKICRDGSYIYETRDGSYRTRFGYRVKNIETVC